MLHFKKIQQNIAKDLCPRWKQGKELDNLVNFSQEDQQMTNPTSKDSSVRNRLHSLFPQTVLEPTAANLTSQKPAFHKVQALSTYKKTGRTLRCLSQGRHFLSLRS